MKKVKEIKNRFMNLGLLKKISILFITLIITIGTIISILLISQTTDIVKEEYQDISDNCAKTVSQEIPANKINDFSNDHDSKQYKDTEKNIQDICNNFDLQNVYAFIPEIKDDQIYNKYIFNVSNTNMPKVQTIQIDDKSKEAIKEIYYGESDEADIINISRNENTISTLKPLRDIDGQIVAVVGVDLSIKQIYTSIIKVSIECVLVVILILGIFALASFIIIKKVIIVPLQITTDTMVGYILNGKLTSTYTPLEPKYDDEIGIMMKSCNTMIYNMKKYYNNINKMKIEKEREIAEEKAAAKVQITLLPETTKIGEITSVDISKYMKPAKNVGGDFYDYFAVDSNHLCISIGDVSGKGVSAALLSVVIHTMIQDYALNRKTPSEILTLVNDRICKQNTEQLFATIFVGILEIDTGRLLYSNAGHNPPIIRNQMAKFLNVKNNSAVGVFEGEKYHNQEILLQTGDMILLYTDGAIDTKNINGERFKDENFLNLIKETAGKSSAETIDIVKNSLEQYSKGAEQFDDTTIVATRILDNNFKVLKIKALHENYPTVRKFILDNISSKNIKLRKNIELVTEEIYVNIANYAYNNRKTGIAQISIKYDKTKVTIIFKDEGMEFNPLKRPNPNIELALEERNEGNLGIYMTKIIMDNVEYARYEGQNILIMSKFIDDCQQ